VETDWRTVATEVAVVQIDEAVRDPRLRGRRGRPHSLLICHLFRCQGAGAAAKKAKPLVRHAQRIRRPFLVASNSAQPFGAKNQDSHDPGKRQLPAPQIVSSILSSMPARSA
jgi:hypothetical protein